MGLSAKDRPEITGIIAAVVMQYRLTVIKALFYRN